MEKDQKPKNPAINLREFLEDYKCKLKTTATEADPDVNIPFFLDKNCTFPNELEDICSADHLASEEDYIITEFQPNMESQRVNMFQPDRDKYVPQTYTLITEHKDKSQHNPFRRSPHSYRLIGDPSENFSFPLTDYELEISVRIYRPPRAACRSYRLERPVFSQEFVCLGSNYLTELRDKIFCICNGKKFIEISNEPEASMPQLTSDPAYFFINGTFYNDTRNPENCDYSEPVLQWARTAHGLKQDEFKVASMQSTRFIDLSVHMGSALQYLHHGNCEHFFVISQVAVLEPHGVYINPSAYPHLRSYNSYNRRNCYTCGKHRHHFIVEKSLRHIYDPSYLCRSCFYSFNYVDGQKVGDFKAYRIYDVEETAEEVCDSKNEMQQDTEGNEMAQDHDMEQNGDEEYGEGFL